MPLSSFFGLSPGMKRKERIRNQYDMLPATINTGACHVHGTVRAGLSRGDDFGSRRFGPKLPDAAHDHRGAVRRRQRARPDRAHHRLADRRSARPAGPGRKRQRRRRHDGGRARGELAARRLSDTARRRRRDVDESDAVQEAALQRSDRLRPDRARRRPGSGADGAERLPRQRHAGVHRLHQGEPRQDAVRFGRRGLRRASQLHARQRRHRRRSHARLLSRFGAGDAGSVRRPARLLLRARGCRGRSARKQAGQGHRDPDARSLAAVPDAAQAPTNRASPISMPISGPACSCPRARPSPSCRS